METKEDWNQDNDTFTDESNQFLTWLTQDAKLTISSKISLRDLRDLNQGRAIVATADIDKGELLFEIPRDSILNIATSQIVQDFPKVKPSLETELGQWEGLIVCLSYEWLVLGSSSKWWPYLQVLPPGGKGSLNTLVYWSEEELSLLRPSLVLNRIGEQGAREMFDRVMEYIDKHGLKSILRGKLSWDEFLHIASVVMSYSFDVERSHEVENPDVENSSDDEENDDSYLKSMVPFADMLNADTKKCNANLVYGSSSLTMRSTKPIASGEQVYNTYGEYPNSEILRRYGYVEWDGSLYDFGEVLLDNIKEALRESFHVTQETVDACLMILQNDDKIVELLDGTEIVTDAYDCYISGEILTEMVALIQIMCTVLQTPDQTYLQEPTLRRHMERVAKKCIQLIETGAVTQKCADVWKLSIDKRLAMYPGETGRSIKEEEEGEEVGTTRDDRSKAKSETLRQSMASTVLIGEFNALSKCRDSLEKQYKVIDDDRLLNNVLKRKLVETESGGSNGHRPSGKKAKRVNPNGS